MIKPSIIKELKHKYGEVYSVNINKKDYVFRCLTYAEYLDLSETHLSSADIEEIVVSKALVWPEEAVADTNKMLPGTVTAIADEVLEYSSFVSMDRTQELINVARHEATQGIEMMKAFILAAMPSYTEEMINARTIKGIARLLALSEVILEIQSGIARGEDIKMSLVGPQEEAEQPKKFVDFDLEDIDKANRAMAGDKGSKIGNAPSSDPIAQKLRSALG